MDNEIIIMLRITSTNRYEVVVLLETKKNRLHAPYDGLWNVVDNQVGLEIK